MIFLDFVKRRTARQESDIELGEPRGYGINGFPSAAKFISQDPDHSFSIYHSLHELSSRNLLYMEAELLELQEQQQDADTVDFRAGGFGGQEFFRSWHLLSTSDEVRQKKRLELVFTIRRKLKEYRTSL